MKKLLFFASAVARLASCSKDMTEDLAAPSVKGNSKVIVSYAGDNEATRTHAESNGVGGYYYRYDTGDALGLFDAALTADKTNAYYGWVDGNIFEGDLQVMEGDKFYGYYPWSRGTEVNNSSIDLYINAEQLYNHKDYTPENGKENPGSFSAAEASAVAYGTAIDDTTADLTFYPAVSYMRVAVVGQGKVAKMTVKMTDAQGTVVPLAGTVNVALAGLKDGSALTEDGRLAATAITFTAEGTASDANYGEVALNCGKGVELDKDTPTYFWFVVPAYLDYSGKTLTITIYGKDDKVGQEFTRPYEASTTPNVTVAGNARLVRQVTEAGNVPFNWIEGAKGAYIIDTPEKFLMYAYAATYEKIGETAIDEVKGAEDLFDEDGSLKPALVVKPIDLDPVAFDKKISNVYEDVTAMTAFAKAVFYDGYKQNSSIETIGGARTFAIRGLVDAGVKPVISNLTVKGNGMFFDGGLNYQPASVVKNLTFSSVKVNAKGVKDIAAASFLLARLRSGNVVDASTAIENVAVDANCAIEADANVNAAIIGVVHAGGAEVSFEEAKIVNNTEIQFADHLYVMGDLEFDETISVDDFNTILVNKYGNVNVGGQAGAVVTVADGDAAKAFIAKEAISRKAEAGSAQPWYSVIDANQTSYWTGLVATAPRGDDYFTAEELAYVVAKGNDENTPVVMTNHITLLNKEWTAAEGIKVYVKNTKNYYISDVKSTNSLFGDEAYVENVTIDKIAVATPYMLAKTGTAKNTTIKGGVFDIEDEVDVVGGLFFEAEADVAAKTTGCQVKASNVPADAAYGALYGKVGIDLGHQIYTFPATATDAYGVFDCYSDKDHEGHASATKIVFPEMTAETMPNAKAIVKWNTAKGTIGANHTVFFLTKEEADLPVDKIDTQNYIMYGGQVTTQDSFTDAIKNAEGGATIKLAKGVYTLPSTRQEILEAFQKENGKPVTIECEEGTVFEGGWNTFEQDGPGKFNYGAYKAIIKNATFRAAEGGKALNGYVNSTFINCKFEGDGYIYPTADMAFEKCEFTCDLFHVDQSFPSQNDNKTVNVAFKDCTIKGWAGLGVYKDNTVKYTISGTTFAANEKGYTGGRFDGDVEFTNCHFNVSQPAIADAEKENDGIILNPATDNVSYKFTNCDNKGVTMTSAFDFVKSYAGNATPGTVTKITVTVDGTTVTYNK